MKYISLLCLFLFGCAGRNVKQESDLIQAERLRDSIAVANMKYEKYIDPNEAMVFFTDDYNPGTQKEGCQQ